MRHLLASVLALAVAPQALAAPPSITARASASLGAAPFAVSFSAEGDASSYEWDFGDGSRAAGASVTHVYARPGLYRAVATGISADGERGTAEVSVVAVGLALRGPARVDYGRPIRLLGRLAPGLVGAPIVVMRDDVVVARTRTRAGGVFGVVLRSSKPGRYAARYGPASSAARLVRVRPALEARLAESAVVGSPLRLAAQVRPAAAGRLLVRVWRDGRLVYSGRRRGAARVSLSTRHASRYRVKVVLEPARGFLPLRRTLAAGVLEPRLALGSRGPSVLVLERRLAELRYAVRGANTVYGSDTYEAVLAFQKVQRLPWTGRVDARVWHALARARTPAPRYAGTHIEVSKGRQYLLLVRGGRVELVVHVSTGATGNTPLGRWRVYRKVTGWDWVLWYPLYFLRGFAIHGYPSVPAYPASHGCVRVPMWVAPRLHAASPYGQTVYVYW